ncbi:MAG: T9SS type A sorting domain-containing protein, partial [Saprospiraceae bacterium]|nr:T9SS type A sorting domain-containing protein [Saprospiraceae bacterium]
TSLTAELTPWDVDQDGEIDTAVVTIWANEFDRSSAPACNSEDEIHFRIELLDGIDDETWEEDADSIDIGCDHVGTQTIRLWVIDEKGSFDYCDVLLVVQNNMGGCGDITANTAVTGNIQNELNESIQEVSVRAELDNGQVLDYLTTASGAYAFATALGESIKVTPVKDLHDMNGISTLDLVKMQKHILAKERLENQHREVAADVNNDGKISTLDLIQLRKMILGKIDKLPESKSWRFFDKVSNKEQYEININDAPMQLNWLGVKIGDVNLDADPKRSAGRSANHLVLNVDNVKMNAGSKYVVNFGAGSFSDITGYQYTLNFDPSALKVVNVMDSEALNLTDENYGLNRLEEGIITSSWNASEAVTLPNGEVIFSLVVEAVKTGQLSDAMTINSKVTKAEAYNSLDKVANVALSFNNKAIDSDEFALYQNSPNPFTEATVIGFNLPSADFAKLTIYDVTGKVLHIQEGDFYKGYNEMQLKKSDISTTGVLYYQLDTEAFTATKKMIHIR